MNILFVLGTARKGRRSQAVFDYVKKVMEDRGDVKIVAVDVRDFPQTNTAGLSEDKRQLWRSLAEGADGYVIVSPEYNHGYPGELKLLLDNAYKEYSGKPVGICGVSDGPLGGARMAEQLKLVVSAFQATPINAAVYFAHIPDLLDDTGVMIPSEYYEARINGMVDELVKYA